MARAKIAITIEESYLKEIDRLVRQGVYPNRSQAIAAAVEARLAAMKQTRLASESSKLTKKEEQAFAEEGLTGESEWPKY